MSDVITGLLLLVGAFFVLVAALGLVRMPDVYIRMHAATKAGTLGAMLILGAAAVHGADLGITARAVAAIAFLLTTAPVAAHLIGRAAYLGGVPLWRGSVADEWGASPHHSTLNPDPLAERTAP